MSLVVHDKVASMQFRPGAHHRSVPAVLKDPRLSSAEKRAILSAWASDMYAVESSPMLRMIPGHTTPLCLSEILSALRGLDDDDPPPRGGAAKRRAGNIDADGRADVAPVGYRLARLQQEADLRAASCGRVEPVSVQGRLRMLDNLRRSLMAAAGYCRCRRPSSGSCSSSPPLPSRHSS